MSSSFSFLTRIQYSFQTDSKKIACFFDDVAAAQISITAYDIYEVNSVPAINLVVGLPDSVVPSWDDQVEKLLDSGKYTCRWCKKEVVQVSGFPSGIPGVIRRLYGAIYCKVRVYHIYLGENTNRIVDSSDNELVKKLLTDPIQQCPRKC